MPNETLSIISGLIALWFITKSVFAPGRKTIKDIGIGNCMYSLHFLFLMEWGGFIVNAVSAARSIVSIKFYKSNRLCWIVVACMTVLFYVIHKNAYDYWILGANISSTLSMFYLNDRYIKAGLALSYIQSFIYAYYVGSEIAITIITVLVTGLFIGSLKDRTITMSKTV